MVMNVTVYRVLAAAFLSVACAALSGCSCGPGKQECITGDEDVCDGGSVPDDTCNSPEEAFSVDGCKVKVGDGCPAAKNGPAAVALEGYITTLADGGYDRDFYSAQLPDGLTPRCLLHVSGGYSVPQTAVNFALNVLAENGTTSIMSGIDKHGAAAPKLVDLIKPFSESNAKLLIQVADEGATIVPKVDNRNAYQLKVEVLENPDSNEPNDTTPTVIPLAAATDGVSGTQSGFLATTDDTDLFSFDVTPTSRQIIYLHITSKMANLLPPPPYRLAYTLYEPGGTSISEGVMDNAFLQVDLSTARLAPGPGTYKLAIYGYKSPGSTAPIAGDLRLKYDIEVRVLPDIDMREPNDSVTTAQTVNVTSGTQTLTGRLSYVADEEWFKLVVAPSGTARTLRYEISVDKAAGRFPQISAVSTRQARLVTQVTTGATAQDRKTNCTNDSTVCPRSFDSLQSSQGQLVSTLCGIADPPQCLWGERNEEAQITALKDMKNFVGAVPVPTSGQTYVLMFRDQGARNMKYADDRVWNIRVTLSDDADEQSRGATPTLVQLGASSVDAPGVISYGYGALLGSDFDINMGDGVRGPNDYDAYETDKDLFEFHYPGGASGDQSWGLEWSIDNLDGGVPPGDLALEVTLCGSGAAPDGGLCGASRRFIFGATLGGTTPWYLPVTNGSQRMLFTKTVTGAATTFTATGDACNCFAASSVTSGKFFVNVAGVNRVANDPLVYHLRQSVNAYPNGNAVCPVTDGGCKFAGQE